MELKLNFDMAEYVPCTRWGFDDTECVCPKCKEAKRRKDLLASEAFKEAKAGKEKIEAFEAEHGPIEDIQERMPLSTKLGATKMRSQKARGLALAPSLFAWGGPYWLKPVKIAAILPQQGKETTHKIGFPVFARPCPVRPRHGFVESRMVRNEKELLALLCETLKADPLGEVMLMKQLTGKASAVATDSGVVWGKGNDGVTAAKGKQFSIPVPPGEKTLTRILMDRGDSYAGKLEPTDFKGGVFMECVEHNGAVNLVQLRDGPAATPVTGNYVPRKGYKVTNVIRVDSHDIDQIDLLDWEKRILAAPEGTAIHLKGSSLTSHLAVHGLSRKLAVITEGKAPRVGARLDPADGQPHPLNKADYETIAKAIRKRMPGSKRSRAAYSVAVLHAQAGWGNEKHLLQLRATGAAMMARLLTSACVGEARHFNGCGPGSRDKKAKPAVQWKPIIGRPLPKGPGRHPGVGRSAVLEKVYRMSLDRLRELAKQCRTDFQGNWGQEPSMQTDRNGRRYWEDGETGYGGPKWAASAQIALDLIEALLHFERTPTAKRWEKVMLCYNKGVAAAHNGGRLLDKWATWDEINSCANNPQLGLLSPQAMFICTGVQPVMGDHLPGWTGREAGKVAKAPEPPKLKGFKPVQIESYDLATAEAQMLKTKAVKEKLDKLGALNMSKYIVTTSPDFNTNAGWLMNDSNVTPVKKAA